MSEIEKEPPLTAIQQRRKKCYEKLNTQLCPHCPKIHRTNGKFYACHKRHKGKGSHQEAQPGPTASSSIAPVIQAAPVIKILQLDKPTIQESLDTDGFASTCMDQRMGMSDIRIKQKEMGQVFIFY